MNNTEQVNIVFENVLDQNRLKQLAMKYNIDFLENDKSLERDLLYLYEYSDEIRLITDNPQFPNIINYVKTGLLTEEELLVALIHK